MKGAMKATKDAEGAFGPLMKLITNMKFFAPILKPLNALLKVLMVSIFKPLMPIFIIIGKQLMGLMPLVEQLGAAIGEGLAEMLEAFMPIITVIIEELLPPLIEILIELIPLFMEFNPLLQALLPALVPLISILADLLILLVPLITAFSQSVKGIMDLTDALKTNQIEVDQATRRQESWNWLLEATNWIMEMNIATVKFFIGVLEDLDDWINDVIDTVKSIPIIGGGGGGGGGGGDSSDKCDDPLYYLSHPDCWGGAAMGAYVPASPGGTPMIVGEGGVDELILPVDQIGSIGGGGHEIHIHLEGAVLNDEYSIDALVRKLRPLLFEVLD